MIVELSGQYHGIYQAFVGKHPDLKQTIVERIMIFRKNSTDTRLHTHALRKRLQGQYAFSVTNEIRIVFEWVGKSKVRFLAIGSHKNVYSRKK